MTRRSRDSCRDVVDDPRLGEPGYRPFGRMIGGLATVLVAAMCALGVLHVGVLVDDGHHVRDGLWVGLKHLSP